MANTEKPKKGGGTGSVSYTAADATFVRKSRKKLNHYSQAEGEGELNIVPFLDIIMNLVMFLLVSQALLVSLGVIDVTAPTYAPPNPSSGGNPDEKPKEDLKLTLGVAVEGFYIAAKGGVLPGLAETTAADVTSAGVARREPTIPLKADGGYDYQQLSHKLREIKTVFPDAIAIFFAADSAVSFEVVVKTLDHSREDSKGKLFPAVAFSRIN